MLTQPGGACAISTRMRTIASFFPSTTATRPRTGARLGGLLLSLSVALCLSGCKQGEGERCQINDDCATGLVCELGGNTPAMGGYCKNTTNSSTDMANPDAASSTVDMTALDM